jgi:hypothetical protein
MDATLIIALIGALVTALGWLVTNLLSASSEKHRRRLIYQTKFIRQQLNQLYGPLAFLLLEGQQTFQALADCLGRDHLIDSDVETFSEPELKAWLFWIDADFFPRNEKIKQLLARSTHLIEGGAVPASFLIFLDHYNSWKINHDRWIKEEIAYSWHSKINWPEQFEKDVLETFQILKQRHARLMGLIEEDRRFFRRISFTPKKRLKARTSHASEKA